MARPCVTCKTPTDTITRVCADCVQAIADAMPPVVIDDDLRHRLDLITRPALNPARKAS